MDVAGPEVPQRTKKRKQQSVESNDAAATAAEENREVPAPLPSTSVSISVSHASCSIDQSVQSVMKFANDVCSTKNARVREDQRDQLNNNRNSSAETEQMKSDPLCKSHLNPNATPSIMPNLKAAHGEKRPTLRANGGVRNATTESVKIRKHSQRRKSSSRKSSANRLSQLQLINFKPFEIFRQLKSISMCLDWIHFKICNGEDERTELFQAVQSKYCSLSVTNANEIFIRKPNAENILRIHSSIVEDVRNFDFYTNCEHYIGSLKCDTRQTFKLPARIENKLTGEVYSVTVEREGDVKFWKIAFVPKTTAASGSGGPENGDENGTPPVADVKVHIGHRWKSVYRLTFLQEISISNQILLLGFLLALASARLESEIFPVFFAVSAILVTFIIFFIIQFT